MTAVRALLLLAAMVLPAAFTPSILADGGPGSILLCSPDQMPCCQVPSSSCHANVVTDGVNSLVAAVTGFPVPSPDLGGFTALPGQLAGNAATLGNAAVRAGGALTPKEPASVMLVGSGQAWSKRGSAEGNCDGQSWFALEASSKPLSLEPLATFAYGGASSPQGALALPCTYGQQRQPIRQDVTGTFDGAWSATKVFPTYSWTLTVSAPVAGGFRDVNFVYATFDGQTQDAFSGRMVEYR